MGSVPTTRGQLMSGPLAGLGVGAVLALYLWPWAGARAAVLAGTVVGVVLGATKAYTLYRSDYGSRHGAITVGMVLLILVSLAGGVAAAATTMTGRPELGGWAMATAAVTILGCTGWAAGREWLRLRAQGADGEWARGHVDLRAGTVRDATGGGMGAPPSRPWGSGASASGWIWVVGALMLNLPLLWRSGGIDDLEVMPWLVATIIVSVSWFGVTWIGPLAARTRFVMLLERQAGRRFVHADLAQLQALRRSWFLSRWLMKEEPPAGRQETPAPQRAPALRRRRRR